MKVTISDHNVARAIKWCNQKFSKGAWTLSTDWPGRRWTITVPNNKIGMVFALKWG